EAQGAERDDATVEVRVTATDSTVLAVRAEDLDRRDGRGECAEPDAGSMGGRGNGTGHGNVRQGAHIVQRDAVPLELDGEHPVPGTGGDVVERVPGAERADPGARGHEVPRLVHRRHADDALREVSVGACPV